MTMGKVISTNIGEKVYIEYQGKSVATGIYKYPVNRPVFLDVTGVDTDQVIDVRYHGGADKACYIYPMEHYAYWKKRYPKLKWEWGMFGENLTSEGILESALHPGDILSIGAAIVQVSQPRQPCFKLGVRFKDPRMVKAFAGAPYPGIYVRVLKAGAVNAGDQIRLIEKIKTGPALDEIFAMLMHRDSDKGRYEEAMANEWLAESARRDLNKIFKPQKD